MKRDETKRNEMVMEMDETGWTGKEGDQTEWNGMGWDETEWNERNGMQWKWTTRIHGMEGDQTEPKRIKRIGKGRNRIE